MRNLAVISLLVVICAVGLGLRLYMLGIAPSGLYIDEAGQGYSAYSVLKTGADEFGMPFPVVFRSFTDFKTPIYIYLIVPLIPIFGLSAFTVRFPSFIFSVLTFPLLYALIGRVMTSKKYRFPLSLLTTFLLAISPWHILFGRTNFECNVALFIYLLGIYLFYRALKNPRLLIVSAVIFAIALPAYHSQRIITPLTVLFLVIRYRQIIFSEKYRGSLIISIVLGTLVTIPTLLVSFTPGFLARAATLNIFSHSSYKPSGYIERLSSHPLGGIVNNSVFLSAKEFASLYVSYFSPRSMFNLGDYGPRSSFPNLATFYVWQFPFYVVGLYFLLRNKTLGEIRVLTIFWLFVSPIPAALTRDPYTSIRALQLVVPQNLIIALGIIEISVMLKGHLRKGLYIGLFVVVIHSMLNLYSSVLILNEHYRAKEWDYGYQQLAEFFREKIDSIPVVFDNARDEHYIQMAFYLKHDPKIFQKENFEVSRGEYYTNLKRNGVKKIGKLVTRGINWQKDLLVDQYLVGDQLAISLDQVKEHRLEVKKEVFYPDGSLAFRVVKTNPGYEINQKTEVR